LFSLSKTTSNASAGPSTPRPTPTPRTATVKFDYDASDTNELTVLAKEVFRTLNLSIPLKNICFLDC
jgi:hypothetical protein